MLAAPKPFTWILLRLRFDLPLRETFSSHWCTGHCHVNLAWASMGLRVVQRGRSCCALGASLVAPDFKSARPDRAMDMGYKLMSTWVGVAVDDGMSGEEAAATAAHPARLTLLAISLPPEGV